MNLYENLEKKYCKFCGKPTTFNSRTKTYNEVCSNRTCRGKHAKKFSDKVIKERYGVDNIFSLREVIDKSKKTKKERYGDENYNNIEQNKHTCLERYGVDNGSKTDHIKKVISLKNTQNKEERLKRAIETFKTHYNVDWNSKDPSICVKIHKSLKETNSQVTIDKLKDLDVNIVNDNFYSYDLKCKTCGTIIENVSRNHINIIHRTNGKLCNRCYPIDKFRSKGEKELAEEILKITNDNVELNKSLFGYSPDVIIPNKKICFDFNGIYWHSEFYRDEYYHRNKKLVFQQNGWNLIYIWEDDWNDKNKREIILLKIQSMLNSPKEINGDECEIKEIPGNQLNIFLEKNDLYSSVKSDLNIGLYYNDELVMVSVFRKIENSYELILNSVAIQMFVKGGFYKIINYFLNNYRKELQLSVNFDWVAPDEFLSCVNQQINFEFIEISKADYCWVFNGIRQNNIDLQKFKDKFDLNLSEDDIMYSLGYYKIYTAGNVKYKISLL